MIRFTLLVVYGLTAALARVNRLARLKALAVHLSKMVAAVGGGSLRDEKTLPHTVAREHFDSFLAQPRERRRVTAAAFLARRARTPLVDELAGRCA